MRKISCSTWSPASRAFWLSTAFIASFSAWGQAAPGSAANAVLGQLATAFSGGQIVQQVQLSGNATWYAGDLEDSGLVSLTASADGSYQMQLSLSTMGQRAESQIGAGKNADCQWAGSDGTTHELSPNNCWKPMIWFLPSLSLQPSLLPDYLQVTDLGTGVVGIDSASYRHLQGSLTFSGLPPDLTASVRQQSVADLGLDSTSLLPSVLDYTIQSDSGSAVLAVEIRYSNYQSFSGHMVPCRIERYLNGSLELAIDVTQVTVLN